MAPHRLINRQQWRLDEMVEFRAYSSNFFRPPRTGFFVTPTNRILRVEIEDYEVPWWRR